jgi:transcription-repair coupling factor (superfamily II helicase)
MPMATADQLVVQFGPNPPIEPITIVNLIQKNRNFRLAGQNRLVYVRHCPSLGDKLGAAKEMFGLLT